ncbi:ABC transporter permease [Trichloromonas sp.]|uniref:ABC transporter permease n=1 Tax=Trichloromonas sp. TaxID=3069249 RepID=UPI002A3F4B31|nr:FtsX-like permease family protein [Trichloromonas sp.]
MLLRLAFRNLWRNSRRTLLTLSAMVVSSALLILALGVFSGMFADMLASVTEQYHGHLVISRPGYQDDRNMFAHFVADPTLIDELRSYPGVRGASPRLRAFGLLAHGDATRPAELLGIDPERETEVTSFAQQLIAGHYPERTEAAALIGSGLAKKLGVVPGDDLVFLTQAADGSLGNDLITVSGIFETGAGNRDNALVLVQLPWLQRLLVLPGKIHELALTIDEPMAAAEQAASLKAGLPADLETRTWGQLLPEMQEVIASYDVSRLILVTILYAATGLGILNTIFMSVLERSREFGILMALGMQPRQVRLLVLLETLILALISLILGVAAGIVMTLYMQRIGIDLSPYLSAVTYAGGTLAPRLSAALDGKNLLIPATALLLVALAAGYFPARRAARLKPVEALRED